MPGWAWKQSQGKSSGIWHWGHVFPLHFHSWAVIPQMFSLRRPDGWIWSSRALLELWSSVPVRILVFSIFFVWTSVELNLGLVSPNWSWVVCSHCYYPKIWFSWPILEKPVLRLDLPISSSFVREVKVLHLSPEEPAKQALENMHMGWQGLNALSLAHEEKKQRSSDAEHHWRQASLGWEVLPSWQRDAIYLQWKRIRVQPQITTDAQVLYVLKFRCTEFIHYEFTIYSPKEPTWLSKVVLKLSEQGHTF